MKTGAVEMDSKEHKIKIKCLRLFIYALAVSSLLFVSSLFNYIGNKEKISAVETGFNEQQQNLTSLASINLENEFKTKVKTIKTLASSPLIVNEKNKNEGDIFAIVIKNNDDIISISHIYLDGSVFNSVQKNLLVTDSEIIQYTKIIKTLSSEKYKDNVYIGDIKFNKDENILFVDIYAPIWVHNKNKSYYFYNGAIKFKINLSILSQKYISNIHSDGNGYCILLSKDIIIYHPNAKYIGMTVNDLVKDSLFSGIISCINTSEKGIGKIKTDNNEIIIAYESIEIENVLLNIVTICSYDDMMNHYSPNPFGEYKVVFWALFFGAILAPLLAIGIGSRLFRREEDDNDSS